MSSVTKPTTTPRWATSPPGNTITEPSSPELDAGFQPGTQAQISYYAITNVLNSHAYNATINGVAATYTSDGSAIAAEIRAGLRDAINGLGQPVTAADTGVVVTVTANTPGVAFVATTTDGANLSVTLSQANKSGKPIRQFVNWLFYWITQWVIYFASAMFDWSDVGSNFAVPGTGTLPTTGAGLTGTSGTGPAYVNGRRVPGPVEFKTFGTNTDVYIDLDQDNVWHYSPVSNGAGAPAVFANSVRMYKVITNGTNRTSAVDLRVAKVPVRQIISFDKKIYLGANNGVGQAATSRIYDATIASEEYTRQEDIVPITSVADGMILRHYTKADGSRIFTSNAAWDQTLDSGGGQWVADVNGGAYLIGFTVLGRVISRAVSAAVAAIPWFDTIGAGGWESAFLKLEAIMDLRQTSPLDPAFFSRVADASGQRVCLFHSRSPFDTTIKGVSIYVTALGTDGLGPAIEITYNAHWNGSQWERQAAGDATKTEIGGLFGGPRELVHIAADATPWDDTVSSGDWIDPYTIHYTSFTGVDAEISPSFDDASLKVITFNGSACNTLAVLTDSSDPVYFWLPLKLPNAELITDCTFGVKVNAGGTPNSTVQIVRRLLASEAPAFDTMKAANAMDTIPTAAGAFQIMVLTLDASVNERTVNNGLYAYGLYIIHDNPGFDLRIFSGHVTTRISRTP